MGEILQAEVLSEMETPIKSKVKSKLKTEGKKPLLDPATHRKLMLLFSRNANVNLSLPDIKLHRLSVKDLRTCQVLNKECADSLCIQLKKLNKNARRRAIRKYGKDSPKVPKFNKVRIPALENLTNGIQSLKDGVAGKAGPSKEKKSKKRRNENNDNSGTLRKKTKTKSETQKSSLLNFPLSTSWEDQFLPTLAGPRAPLPPAPLLSLANPLGAPLPPAGPLPPAPLLTLPKPLTSLKPEEERRAEPHLPFNSGRNLSVPPLLKPIHPMPNLVRGRLPPGLPLPPPLHGGSSLHRFKEDNQPGVSGVASSQDGAAPPRVLPAAPDLALPSRKSLQPPPMVPYPAPVPKVQESKVSSGWKYYLKKLADDYRNSQASKIPQNTQPHSSVPHPYSATQYGSSIDINFHKFPAVTDGTRRIQNVSTSGSTQTWDKSAYCSYPTFPTSTSAVSSGTSVISKASSSSPIFSLPQSVSSDHTPPVYSTTATGQSLLWPNSSKVSAPASLSADSSLPSNNYSPLDPSHTSQSNVSVANTSISNGVSTSLASSSPFPNDSRGSTPSSMKTESSSSNVSSLVYTSTSASKPLSNSSSNLSDRSIASTLSLAAADCTLSKPSQVSTESSSVIKPKDSFTTVPSQLYFLLKPLESAASNAQLTESGKSSDGGKKQDAEKKSESPITSSLPVPDLRIPTLSGSLLQTESESTPTVRRVGFKSIEELEDYIVEWLKENYVISMGHEIEQYKVLGHFQSSLYVKGRYFNRKRWKIQHPLPNCVKKLYGDVVTTRRHRAAEGQQRWHYCNLKLRDEVSLPSIRPPKSRVRIRKKKNAGVSTDSTSPKVSQPSDIRVPLQAPLQAQQFSSPSRIKPPSYMRMTCVLAALARQIDPTKLPNETDTEVLCPSVDLEYVRDDVAFSRLIVKVSEIDKTKAISLHETTMGTPFEPSRSECETSDVKEKSSVEPATDASIAAKASIEPAADDSVAIKSSVEHATDDSINVESPVEPAINESVAAKSAVEHSADDSKNVKSPVEPLADYSVAVKSSVESAADESVAVKSPVELLADNFVVVKSSVDPVADDYVAPKSSTEPAADDSVSVKSSLNAALASDTKDETFVNPMSNDSESAKLTSEQEMELTTVCGESEDLKVVKEPLLEKTTNCDSLENSELCISSFESSNSELCDTKSSDQKEVASSEVSVTEESESLVNKETSVKSIPNESKFPPLNKIVASELPSSDIKHQAASSEERVKTSASSEESVKTSVIVSNSTDTDVGSLIRPLSDSKSSEAIAEDALDSNIESKPQNDKEQTSTTEGSLGSNVDSEPQNDKEETSLANVSDDPKLSEVIPSVASHSPEIGTSKTLIKQEVPEPTADVCVTNTSEMMVVKEGFDSTGTITIEPENDFVVKEELIEESCDSRPFETTNEASDDSIGVNSEPSVKGGEEICGEFLEPLHFTMKSEGFVAESSTASVKGSTVKGSVHLTKWLHSKLSRGKIVQEATAFVCLEKLRHCQVTNLFMKRNRINTGSGLRARQMLRTWDIKGYLKGVAASSCIPTLKREVVPKESSYVTRPSHVPRMVMGSSVAGNNLTWEESTAWASWGGIFKSNAYYSKKLAEIDDILNTVELESITPIFGRRDKYLLMRNERLTGGQKKFAYRLGLDLAKRACRNKRLDRVDGIDRKLHLCMFGLKKDSEKPPAPANWSMVDEVRDGKPGTSVIYGNPGTSGVLYPPEGNNAASSSGSIPILPKPKRRLKQKFIILQPGQGQPTQITSNASTVPQLYTYPSNPLNLTHSTAGKVYAKLAFPHYEAKAQNAATSIATSSGAAAAMLPPPPPLVPPPIHVNSQDPNNQLYLLITPASGDKTVNHPTNRSSPPPRLTFMGGSGVGYASSAPRESTNNIRLPRPTLAPPPLSFMGPQTTESAVRQPSSHPVISQGNGQDWSGNVNYPFYLAPQKRNYGVINLARPEAAHQPNQVVHHLPYINVPHSTPGPSSHLERQLNQVHSRANPSPDHRPSSVTKNVQGHVTQDQLSLSEPRSMDTTVPERHAATVQPYGAEGGHPHNHPHKNVLHRGNSRPLYIYSQAPKMDVNTGVLSGQGLVLSNQPLYNQPHTQNPSYPHQQQSNIPHNLPAPVLPSQPVSSQSYRTNQVYPTQQVQNVQPNTVQNHSIQGHTGQEGQMYGGQQQQPFLNQNTKAPGFKSSQIYSGTQVPTASQQLSSSSYSIQNLILPTQSYRVFNPSSAMQATTNCYVLQSTPSENTVSTVQSMQQGGNTQQVSVIKQPPPLYSSVMSSRQQQEKHEAYRNSALSYSSNSTENRENYESSVTTSKSSRHSIEQCNQPSSMDKAYGDGNKSLSPWLPNLVEPSPSFERRESDNLTSVFDGSLDVLKDNVPKKNEESLDLSVNQENYKGNNVQGSLEVESNSEFPSLQNAVVDVSRALSQETLEFAEKTLKYLGDEKSSSENSSEAVLSFSSPKESRDTPDKNNSIDMQESLPSDLDQINVSRFGLEDDSILSISNILPDADKCNYQKEDLFDRLETNQPTDLSKVSKDSSFVSCESSSKDTVDESSQSQLPSSSEVIPNAQEIKSGLSEQITKIEPVLLKLMEIGLPSSRNNIVEAVAQILEMEGTDSNSMHFEADLQKWYEGFSSSHGCRPTDGLNEEHFPMPVENDVVLWINKVKGELLPFSSASGDRIFYMQELNFLLDRKTRQIKFHKMFDNTKVNSSEKDTVSVLVTFSADGRIGPGMIIFPRMVIPEKLFASLRNTEGGKEWVLGSSSNGWLYSDSISEFVTDVFIPWVEGCELQLPIALFTSEHISNVSLSPLSHTFVPQGVHLILVPNPLASIISPASKTLVQYFLKQWGKSVRQWKVSNNIESLAEENFAPFMVGCIRNRISNGHISETFKDLGMWPFDGKLVYEQFQLAKL